MASKAKSSKTLTMTPAHWLIVAAALLGGVALASAMGKTGEPVGVNEVRTTGVLESSYTGVVSREAINDKGKEDYVLTLDSGTKYILIGLKREYEDKGAAVKPSNAPSKGKPSSTPKPTTPRADQSDVNSFEQYLGKRITVSGLVVPVGSGSVVKPSPKASMPSQAKGGKPSVAPSSKPADVGPSMSRLVVKSIAVVN